ncbi:c-type cytochrome [Endothiovibrio diazotrophicus]
MPRPFALLLAAVLAGTTLTATAEPARCDNPAAAIRLTDEASCYQGLQPPQVSCLIPDEVEGALGQENYNTVQRASDLFSWQQFIALNWPASREHRGRPAAGKPVTAKGPRVWETWKEGYEVYLPDGARPAPWNEPQPMPAACGNAHGKWLMRTAKVSDVVDQTLQALPADATLKADLKDQQGRLVRYEIRLNQPLFHYIREHRLYDGRVQAKAEKIDFPLGSQLVKAAWREVDGDDAEYFLTRDACVCDDDGNGDPVDCAVEKMGLAGFHIMTRTAAAPQWIWSTFEQVDNTTRIHPAVEPLNDPDCRPERCPQNVQTADHIPNQLTRVIPVPDQAPNCARTDLAADNLALLNHDVQNDPKLLDSFLRYYELVGTQWPIDGSKEPVKTAFAVHPELLGNTTMESFSQNTSSCMGCHVMSRTLNPQKYVSADFSFTLNNAKPTPPGARCVNVEASGSCSDDIVGPLPEKPRDEWEHKHWDEIQLGYQVTTRTYEVVGTRNVGNRLHCESCHLNAGGNPAASWWVDVERRYPTTSGTTLQERINGCFERSMNGYPLCSTADGPAACDRNPVMVGLTTYMEWLTREYHKTHFEPTDISGFAGSLEGFGDAARGRAIYTQKCAFCHNNAGQGRYEHDTYFRPALWGPDSFNACAGLAAAPVKGQVSMLANFLQGNMPYTSGGMLTGTEADDLTAYINTQCRPGKGGVGPDGEVCPPAPGCVDGVQVPLP